MTAQDNNDRNNKKDASFYQGAGVSLTSGTSGGGSVSLVGEKGHPTDNKRKAKDAMASPIIVKYPTGILTVLVTPEKGGDPPASKKAKVSKTTVADNPTTIEDVVMVGDNGLGKIYTVVLPVTEEGLLCNVQKSEDDSGYWFFSGYLRSDDGTMGDAEKQGLMRNCGEIILQMDGHVLKGKTMEDICRIHEEACVRGGSVKVVCMERIKEKETKVMDLTEEAAVVLPEKTSGNPAKDSAKSTPKSKEATPNTKAKPTKTTSVEEPNAKVAATSAKSVAKTSVAKPKDKSIAPTKHAKKNTASDQKDKTDDAASKSKVVAIEDQGKATADLANNIVKTTFTPSKEKDAAQSQAKTSVAVKRTEAVTLKEKAKDISVPASKTVKASVLPVKNAVPTEKPAKKKSSEEVKKNGSSAKQSFSHKVVEAMKEPATSAQPVVSCLGRLFEFISEKSPQRIAKNADDSVCCVFPDDSGRGDHGMNCIIAINDESTAGMSFKEIGARMTRLRAEKRPIKIGCMDLRDLKKKSTSPVLLDTPSFPVNVLPSCDPQQPSLSVMMESSRPDNKEESIPVPVKDEPVGTANKGTVVLGDHEASDVDEAEEDCVMEIVYRMSSKKVAHSLSLKAAEKLLTWLQKASKDNDKEGYKEFLDCGAVYHTLKFMERKLESENALHLSARIFVTATAMDLKFGIPPKEKIAEKTAVWKHAIESLQRSIAENKDASSVWAVLGELWASMASVTDAIAESNGKWTMDLETKKHICDSALLFLPDHFDAFLKTDDRLKVLQDILCCLSGLCDDSRKTAINAIRSYYAKVELDHILIAMLDHEYAKRFLDNEGVMDHLFYNLWSSLEGKHVDTMLPMKSKKTLGFCVEAMKRFKTNEDMQRNCFYCMQCMFKVVDKNAMLQHKVVSTLAVCILDNDKLTSDEANELKKDVAKFIGTIVKKLSFAN